MIRLQPPLPSQGGAVIVIPEPGGTPPAARPLASALGDIPLALAALWPSADEAEPTSLVDRAAALARELTEGALPDRLVVAGQGLGSYIAVELVRRLERLAPGVVSAVVVAAQLPIDAYKPDPAEPIETPLHVWAATRDPSAPGDEAMLAWREYTDGPTTFRAFEGSPDFLFTRAEPVAAQLRRLAAPRVGALHA